MKQVEVFQYLEQIEEQLREEKNQLFRKQHGLFNEYHSNLTEESYKVWDEAFNEWQIVGELLDSVICLKTELEKMFKIFDIKLGA